MSQELYYVWGTEELTECTWFLTSGNILSIPHCLKSEPVEPCTSLFLNLSKHTPLTPAHSSSMPWPLQRYHPGCTSFSYSSHGYPFSFFILIVHSYSIPFYFFRALVPDFIITYWYICILVCLLTENHEFHAVYIYPWPITWSRTHYKVSRKGKKCMDFWINSSESKLLKLYLRMQDIVVQHILAGSLMKISLWACDSFIHSFVYWINQSCNGL